MSWIWALSSVLPGKFQYVGFCYVLDAFTGWKLDFLFIDLFIGCAAWHMGS